MYPQIRELLPDLEQDILESYEDKLQDLGQRMVELRSTAPREPTDPTAIKEAITAGTA